MNCGTSFETLRTCPEILFIVNAQNTYGSIVKMFFYESKIFYFQVYLYFAEIFKETILNYCLFFLIMKATQRMEENEIFK